MKARDGDERVKLVNIKISRNFAQIDFAALLYFIFSANNRSKTSTVMAGRAKSAIGTPGLPQDFQLFALDTSRMVMVQRVHSNNPGGEDRIVRPPPRGSLLQADFEKTDHDGLCPQDKVEGKVRFNSSISQHSVNISVLAPSLLDVMIENYFLLKTISSSYHHDFL